MARCVGESRSGLVADAVDAEMPGGGNHVPAALVVAGTVIPRYAAVVVAVDEVQAPGLFVFGGGVGEAHGNAARAEVLDGGRLAVLPRVAHGQPVGRAGADSRQQVAGHGFLPCGRQGNVAGGLFGYLIQRREVKGQIHNGRVQGQVLHTVVGVKKMVEGGPLDGDGKAVVGCRCGRVVLYRDTVFLPALLLGRVQGPGDRLRRAAVVCRPGSRTVPHGDGCFNHGQYGAVRLGRFRGCDRHIGTAVIVVIAASASAGIGFNGHNTACFLAAVLGDDGDGGRPLFDGGYVAACVHGRYVGIAGLPAHRLV